MKRKYFVSFFYYAILTALSLGIFYSINHISDDFINLLMEFYKNTVEIFFGGEHFFYENLGCFSGGNYIITKDCLGLNIIALLFGVCALSLIAANAGKYGVIKKILLIMQSGIMAVVLGVVSNILRLLSSIYFTTFINFEIIHALLGIVIYLSASIFCYVVLMRTIKGRTGGVKNVN